MKDSLIGRRPTIDSIVTRMGFGWFQGRLFAILGVIMLADGCDAILTPLLAELLQKKWLLSDTQAAMLGGVRYFGMIISSLFFGGLGDWAGRRNTLKFALLLMSVCSIASVAAPEFWSFLVSRSLVGFLFGCCKPVVSCYSVEMSPLPVRSAATIGLFIFYNLGSLGAVGVAFVLTPDFDPTNFRGLLLVQAVAILVAAVVATFWLEESPSFLCIRNKPEAAISALNKVAKVNRKPELTGDETEVLKHVQVSAKKFSFQRLFSHQYLPRTIVGAFLWWVGSYTFYGFLFILPRRGSRSETSASDMSNMAVEISMLLPGVFVSMPMVEIAWLGQVRTMLIFAVGMAVSSVSCVFLSGVWGAVMSSAFIFSSNVFGLVLYPYTSELFDAALRNTGFSFCSFWSRIGGVVSPFILVAFARLGEEAAYYSFAVHSVAAAVVLMTVKVKEKEGV